MASEVYDLKMLLEGATTRYRSLRAGFLLWHNQESMIEGLARFKGNPYIARWLNDLSGHSPNGHVHHAAWRIWFSRPAFHRQERYLDSTFEEPVSIAGGDGSISWSWGLGMRRVRVSKEGPNQYLATLPRKRRDLRQSNHRRHGSGVARWFHPVVGELIEPAELLRAGPSIEVLGTTEWRGRQAIQASARLGGWDHDRRHGKQENFPPADDYRLLVDSATGVILRTASRFDAREFSAVEAMEIQFDEELPLSLFEPGTGRRAG